MDPEFGLHHFPHIDQRDNHNVGEHQKNTFSGIFWHWNGGQVQQPQDNEHNGKYEKKNPW